MGLVVKKNRLTPGVGKVRGEERSLCGCGRVQLVAEREIQVSPSPSAPALTGLPGWNHFACGHCGEDLGTWAWSEPWRICILPEGHVEC